MQKKINLSPIILSITVALLFFFLGRYFVIQMGNNGVWAVIILLAVFYAVWYMNYRRKKKP